jgi:hypothetical protein
MAQSYMSNVSLKIVRLRLGKTDGSVTAVHFPTPALYQCFIFNVVFLGAVEKISPSKAVV